MKIRTKIVLLLVLCVVVPLLPSHHFIAKETRRTMSRMVREQLASEATQAARHANDRLAWAAEGLGLVVQSIPFESFSAQELRQALALPYRQLSDAAIVALLDEGGKALAPPYRPQPDEAAMLARALVSDADLEAFSQNVPLEAALTARVAFGPTYRSDEGEPRIVGAASFAEPGSGRRWVLAVELSLAALCADVVAAGPGGERTRALYDSRGYPICAPRGEPWRPVADAASILGAEPGAVVARERAGGRVLRTSAEVALTGWRLVVEQDEGAVMAPVARTTAWILVSAGVVLVVAVLGGLLLARGITGPIAELEAAARQVAEGAYGKELAERSADEVGSLARAFNRMTAEIRAWNTELKDRVEARTRELKEAQLQILQSQKLAAVGELGAGVAHEINNPLTGVIGLAQLARAEAPAGSELAATLDEILANARRVAEVVDALLRFSQSQVSPEMRAVDAGAVLAQAAAFYAARIAAQGIEVRRLVEPECTVPAVEGELQIAVNHLVDNAVRAMPGGGRLDLEAAHVEGGAVRIAVRDDGAGMSEAIRLRAAEPFFSTEAPGSGAKGLGLWIAHRVAEDHGGRIVLESAEGRGTTATLYLPGRIRLSKV